MMPVIVLVYNPSLCLRHYLTTDGFQAMSGFKTAEKNTAQRVYGKDAFFLAQRILILSHWWLCKHLPLPLPNNLNSRLYYQSRVGTCKLHTIVIGLPRS